MSVRSINTLVTQTLAEDTSGWYRVKLTSGMTKREAGWTKQADTLKVWPTYTGENGWSKWVFAGSWQTAAYTVLGQLHVR
jgi:hypothetical protein